MDIGKKKIALVTGAAGFIGYHTSKRLLEEGWRVVGLDSMSDYYDVSLKEHRESMLLQNTSYKSIHEKVETPGVLEDLFEMERPDVVIHLAAQAGVRHSIEKPREYLESNINGTFELLEAARTYPPKHMLIASTSSVYGANQDMPYRETTSADHQMSFYAATKKSTESIAHSYAHLFDLPITMFRFFTVYGPWGRPDMAPHKFAKAIFDGEPIDVYNGGEMWRDFTYIDDLVQAISALLDKVPMKTETTFKTDSKSPVAPFRIVNIGNSQPVKLTQFIEALETSIGVDAQKKSLPMQQGDVTSTWADVSLLDELTQYTPKTKIAIGVAKFVDWFEKYYQT